MAAILCALVLQQGLQSEYWENHTTPNPAPTPPAAPTTAPTKNPIQTVLDFHDGNPPAAGAQAWVATPLDNFFVRWTGYVRGPVTGTVTFETLTDDGVELRVGANAVITNWTFHGDTTDTGNFQMTLDAWYPIQILFFEGTGGARFRLRWSYPGQALQVIPATFLSVTPPPPPPTPTISASQGAGFTTDINVTWSDSGAGVTYTLQRSDNGGNYVTILPNTPNRAFTDFDRPYGQTFCYQVLATSTSAVSSPYSTPPACVTMALPPPRVGGDNDEGFLDGDCACGASATPAGLGFAALALLAAGLRRRRPAVH